MKKDDPLKMFRKDENKKPVNLPTVMGQVSEAK